MGNLLRLKADDGRHAAREKHAGKRDDEGLYLQIRDQEALHQSECQANEQCKQRSRKDASSAVHVHNAAHHHQRGDAADGDVDTAADHHHGQSAGHNDERSIVVEHVKELLPAQETAAPDGHGKEIHAKEDANRDGHQQLGVRQRLPLPQGLCLLHAATSFLLLRRMLLHTCASLAFTTGEPMATIRMMTTAL